jgi:hypothetical protein
MRLSYSGGPAQRAQVTASSDKNSGKLEPSAPEKDLLWRSTVDKKLFERCSIEIEKG